MRVFVSFQEIVHKLDVGIRETVGDIKNTLRERFGLNLKNQRNETDQFVSLVYQGSNLQNNWVYSDLGIPPGSTLVCSVEKQIEPTLSVRCINYDEMVEYRQNFNVWDTSVGALRGMIQDSTGIHVSAFRLFSKSGLELFDCHPLKVYGVDRGDTVTMEIWRDVADVVHAARENDITDTLGSLASFQDRPHLMRYQLQLGLFTAAHYDYHQLATQLMKCGAKPDEPVGQHPSRDWCRASAHVDHVKTPAHEAAQHGRLKCLQHFLMFNYAVLICKDAHGLTPCNVARRHKQTECFKLLVAEQFRIPSVHPELSVHVYSRVRKWCDRARMRARLHKDKTALLLLSNAEVAQKCAVVGQKVEVDGFNDLGRGRRKIKSAPSSLKPYNTPGSNLHDTSYMNGNSYLDDSKSQNSNVQRRNRELHQRSTGGIYPVGSVNTTPGKKSPLSSAYVASRVSRAMSCDSTRGEHEVSIGEMHREPTSAELRNSGKRPNSRYIWKSFDDVRMENEDNLRTSMDKRSQTRTPGIYDQHDPVKPNDTRKISAQSRCKLIGSYREVNGSTVSYTSEKQIPQDDRPGLRRDKIGEVTSRMNRQSSITRETYNARKGPTPSKSGSALEASHQADSPVKRRSARSRDLIYQGSVESNADVCLRVACETFRKKSWLGQLQMALVVNTNMCKRR